MPERNRTDTSRFTGESAETSTPRAPSLYILTAMRPAQQRGAGLRENRYAPQSREAIRHKKPRPGLEPGVATRSRDTANQVCTTVRMAIRHKQTPTRTRTRNSSLEARNDRPFHHRGILLFAFVDARRADPLDAKKPGA